MKIVVFLILALISLGCTTAPKMGKVAGDKAHRQVEKEIKLSLPAEGLKSVQSEKVAFLNIHDFPDSALLSAKIKMNPPDLAIDEAKSLQMDRAEILRQSLQTYCDECQNFEVVLPIEKLSEGQFNFFFDKIFLRQEVISDEVGDLFSELKDFDKLVLILSSEDYEKNRGLNKENQVVALTEAFIKSEVYVFDLKKRALVSRLNINLSNKDYLFYEKKDTSDRAEAKIIEDVKDTGIKTLLNDFRYDEAYPFPIVSESLTLFHFLYNELCKTLFMEAE